MTVAVLALLFLVAASLLGYWLDLDTMTISVTDVSSLSVGDRLIAGDQYMRVVGVDDHTVTVQLRRKS